MRRLAGIAPRHRWHGIVSSSSTAPFDTGKSDESGNAARRRRHAGFVAGFAPVCCMNTGGGTALGKLVVQRERWERLERVFAQALDWPAAEWPKRLARACGDDVELLREVSELLGAHARRGMLDTPLLIADAAGIGPNRIIPDGSE